jgi:DnaK suppressor protein
MIDLTTLKATLEETLLRVTKDLENIAVLDEHTGDWVAIPDTSEPSDADENSEADGVEEWNERQATLSQLETLYRNTKRALSKITEGTFGTCEVCTETIESERLSVMPTARTCKNHMDDERSLSL